MSRRTLAGILAVPMLIALWVTAVLVPLPYVTYSPGITVDVLGETSDGEIIEVSGHQAYRDEGQLRMTTVYVTQPEGKVNLFEAVGAWLSRTDAVYPREAVYAPEETRESSRMQSAVQMVSSQDAAVAVALRELGYPVQEAVEVLNVTDNMPAQGKLQVGDELLRVGGRDITSAQDVVDAVTDNATAGEPIEFVFKRAGDERTEQITPMAVPDEDGTEVLRVGIVPGRGYSFPFDVKVNIDESIGGPSAGLMFSLAIYDTLTEGSLTGEAIVAGTGTIDEEGLVGPIGGIQQKIVAAQDVGAELFLVPADNCPDALGARSGDMALVRVQSMHEATEAIESWVGDPTTELPVCAKE
ncbi:PDZ domain-containing protein [Nocardioides sp.]|uniref:YlbL family protein n=1 Tax=Nocardioides sp. TaxID=35761 RepID=UPI0027374C65|nr:PDZ domain-containing protein [Nocardioides sp.]MDP3890881.1 PDZ domain-containing protein [Nocardioides sp.]